MFCRGTYLWGSIDTVVVVVQECSVVSERFDAFVAERLPDLGRAFVELVVRPPL